MLEDLNVKQERTIMVVLHELDLARRFFDRLLVIYEGRLVADGPSSQVMTGQLLETVFRIKATVGREPLTDQPVIVCQRGVSSRETGFS